MKFRYLIVILLLKLINIPLEAKDNCLKWDVSAYGMGATQRSLPFWAVTNKKGILNTTHSALFTAGFDYEYKSNIGFLIFTGVDLVGTMTPMSFNNVYTAPIIQGYEDLPVKRFHSECNGTVHQMYVGIGYRFLRIDFGLIDRDTDAFNGLSLTGGDMLWTGNARNLPGYNIQIREVAIPGTKGVVSVMANWADYKFMDKRYVDYAFLHNKSLFFRFRLHQRVSLKVGLEHWTLWGGYSPEYGKQPYSFKDYVRVFAGMSGGSGASINDQKNALGDIRGRELVQVDWQARNFKMSFAHDIPFDDGSGMGLQNFPDGVNSISLSFNDRERWITDLLYEFVYTKSQSGPKERISVTEEELLIDPNKKDHILGGNDDYFNNGEYKSGWTNHGRTIGLPLFTPMPINEDGLYLGVCNNRIVAHHVGIGGKLWKKWPYRFKATYSKNYGQYNQRLDIFKSKPQQVSLALEVDVPELVRGVPVGMSVGAYGDIGELYNNNFGLTVRFRHSGEWSRKK